MHGDAASASAALLVQAGDETDAHRIGILQGRADLGTQRIVAGEYMIIWAARELCPGRDAVWVSPRKHDASLDASSELTCDTWPTHRYRIDRQLRRQLALQHVWQDLEAFIFVDEPLGNH